jgi:CRP-like cAMP-binding protein
MQKMLWRSKIGDVFSNLALREQQVLESMSRRVSIRSNEIIYLSHDLIEHVFWIEHGCIQLSRVNVEGQRVILDILGPGEIFGALAWAEKNSRNHSASALDVDFAVCPPCPVQLV